MVVRFSDYFHLGKSQADLDFVDIPLDTDIPLFVDPYAISLENSPWFIGCNNLIVDFFQLVVDSIRNAEVLKARRLLASLHEPNDTHLGLSHGRPQGRGIGADQANQLYQRLSESKAVRTGLLRDLSDAELLIPGVGNDKISDVTTNIIRRLLIEYTQSQCNLYEIATQQIASGMFWDANREIWRNHYFPLPTYNGRRILLVPKVAVRYGLTVDHQHYYRHFVLEYLRVEHLDASSSLVTALKNGKRKVYIKDLEKEYPLSKNFLFTFSEEHPEVLDKYRDSLPTVTEPLDNEHIEERQPDPRNADGDFSSDLLDSIAPGRPTASTYHNFILDALIRIFSPALTNPTKEQSVNEGRMRVDITFMNRAQAGFFFSLNTIHHARCPFVFFECKNYSDDPANPEFDQLTGRFSDLRGRVGFIVCRSVTNRSLTLQRCKDALRDGKGYVLVLEDRDIKQLLHFRKDRDQRGVDTYLDQRLAEIVL